MYYKLQIFLFVKFFRRYYYYTETKMYEELVNSDRYICVKKRKKITRTIN